MPLTNQGHSGQDPRAPFSQQVSRKQYAVCCSPLRPLLVRREAGRNYRSRSGGRRRNGRRRRSGDARVDWKAPMGSRHTVALDRHLCGRHVTRGWPVAAQGGCVNGDWAAWLLGLAKAMAAL